ncbi:ABC transporter permease [bacterium]|nr:ABC transporter permease [bacterium]
MEGIVQHSKSTIQFRRFIRNLRGLLGGLLVLFLLLVTLFGPQIAPYGPDDMNLRDRLKQPAYSDTTGKSKYLLGADQLGRDLYSRIIYGARTSITIGVLSVSIGMVVGVLLGLLAGYFGGIIEDIIMRISDIQLAFPFILLAILFMAIFGSGFWKIVIILSFSSWVGFTRVTRSEVLTIKEMEYVHAVKSVGASHVRIMFIHILPNVLSSIVVISTLQIANNILLEASLTFIGVGISPDIPAWGSMLAEGRDYFATAWWIATFPGIAIMLPVLGFNLLGDWLRDRLDPNLDV